MRWDTIESGYPASVREEQIASLTKTVHTTSRSQTRSRSQMFPHLTKRGSSHSPLPFTICRHIFPSHWSQLSFGHQHFTRNESHQTSVSHRGLHTHPCLRAFTFEQVVLWIHFPQPFPANMWDLSLHQTHPVPLSLFLVSFARFSCSKCSFSSFQCLTKPCNPRVRSTSRLLVASFFPIHLSYNSLNVSPSSLIFLMRLSPRIVIAWCFHPRFLRLFNSSARTRTSCSLFKLSLQLFLQRASFVLDQWHQIPYNIGNVLPLSAGIRLFPLILRAVAAFWRKRLIPPRSRLPSFWRPSWIFLCPRLLQDWKLLFHSWSRPLERIRRWNTLTLQLEHK